MLLYNAFLHFHTRYKYWIRISDFVSPLEFIYETVFELFRLCSVELVSNLPLDVFLKMEVIVRIPTDHLICSLFFRCAWRDHSLWDHGNIIYFWVLPCSEGIHETNEQAHWTDPTLRFLSNRTTPSSFFIYRKSLRRIVGLNSEKWLTIFQGCLQRLCRQWVKFS